MQRPRPAVIGALCLLVSALGAVVTGPGPRPDPTTSPVRVEAAPETATTAQRRILDVLTAQRGPAAVTTDDRWSGFAFDACRAPSQRVMDRWLRTSPFLGVGVYLGGIHRACEQRHLTRGWVARQTRAGWRLLPLWVGPQASCTGYRWRIHPRPARAARDGVRQARGAVRAARRLGIGAGATLWYDLEPFPSGRPRCQRAALRFVDGWTRELHRQGYLSGLYSHVRAGVALVSRAPKRYAAPDRVWFAYVNHRPDAEIPRRYVRKRGWMRASKVHQFALDKRVEFGGVAMHIDWNWVSLGRAPGTARSAPCGRFADRTPHPTLSRGVRSRAVPAVQCLLRTVGHPVPVEGKVLDRRTTALVARFQRSRGLSATGSVDRRTWMALLSTGPRPVLKQGSAGPSVRRLQRTLNAALPRDVRVDGGFGRRTAAAVRRYQALVGLRPSGIVAEATWHALARGTVHHPRPVRKAKRRR